MTRYSCDVFDPDTGEYCPAVVYQHDVTISANRWNERLVELEKRTVPASAAHLCLKHYNMRDRLDDDGEVVMVYDRVEF